MFLQARFRPVRADILTPARPESKTNCSFEADSNHQPHPKQFIADANAKSGKI